MDEKGKRLLILGAGRGQIGLYKAAKELGIVSIAGTMPNNNPPGIKLADEVCYMDISNPKEVLKKAKNLKLDGIATCCLDTGVPALGRVCSELGLVGLSDKAAEMCKDKAKMKRAFIEHNVSTAQYHEIYTEKDLDNALQKINFPVIVKAIDLGGSRGIYIAKNIEEAYEGFRNAMKITKKNHCIVEEYIQGWEFGAQAFVHNGEILFVMPHGDETFMSHTAVPVGHYVPLDCSEDILKQTDVAARRAIKALGLDNCAVNMDFILKDGVVYVIELTGRIGANCLPELVEINYGIEYYKMVASMAVGENPLKLWAKRRGTTKAGLAKMIFNTGKTGVLNSIEYKGKLSENIVDITFFRHQGDVINHFEVCNDCVGQIVVQGETIKNCQETLETVLSQIEMKLQ